MIRSDATLFILILIIFIASAVLSGSGFSATERQRAPTPFSNTNTPGGTTTPPKDATERDIARQIRALEGEVRTLEKNVSQFIVKETSSPLRGKLTLSGVSGRGNIDTRREYITIRASSKNTEPVNLTGLVIMSTSTRNTVIIGRATELYFSNTVNSKSDILLPPGKTAIIATGLSPIGESFQINTCSGYHTQSYTFYPSLPQECPLPRNEDLSSIPPTPVNDACFDIIERYPRCRIQTKPLPATLSQECNEFIHRKINYPTCVNVHKNDSGFFKGDWRIYLGRSDPLWKQRRETILLLDREGKIIDMKQY